MTELVVEIDQGKLRGKSFEDYHKGKFLGFLGIPYAKAPVGNLRFKAPEPPESWDGTRNATIDGPECPSWDMFYSYNIGKEDNCLNLNVFTKNLPKSKIVDKKPVMVYFYGGGFMFGTNKIELYGPQYLMTEDIVLVVPNYRIGVLGFLSLKDPSLGVPGNAGLKDQVMALRWVQKNIHKFGGDPNNVTIFGQSAGGASVHYLTLSPLSKGLFHKTIAQSGCALNTWAEGKNNALDIAREIGYKETDENVILKKLRKENIKKIVNAQFKIEDYLEAGISRPFGPVIEPHSKNAFLTKSPVEILKAGEQHQIPIIIGYNSLEGIFFELVKKARFLSYPTSFERDIPLDLGLELNGPKSKELAEKIKKFYFGNEKISSNLKKLYELKSDTTFVYKIQKTIELLQKSSTQPLYTYRISLDDNLNMFKRFAFATYFIPTHFLNFLTKLCFLYIPSLRDWAQWLTTRMPESPVTSGASHTDDVFYLFKTVYSPAIEIGSDEDMYVQRFVRLWTNFARSGDPTPIGDEVVGGHKWRSLDSTRMEFFDIGEEMRMTDNKAEEKRVAFWEEIYKTFGKQI